MSGEAKIRSDYVKVVTNAQYNSGDIAIKEIRKDTILSDNINSFKEKRLV